MMRGVLLLLALVVSHAALTGALDPDSTEGQDEECGGGPPGVRPGDMLTGTAEAKGVDNVERCLSQTFTGQFIQDIEWRCETRYCCETPCDCERAHIRAQETPCDDPEDHLAELTCLVQHPHQPRWHQWICCDHYVQHPDTLQCLITCEKDNGNCAQLCTDSEEAPHQAVCSCNKGYTISQEDPTQCEEIDECSSSPCVNGGTCTDLDNGFMCSCKAGFTGIDCAIDVNECSSDPCLNGGLCFDLVNGYRCTCEPEYIGVHCESAVTNGTTPVPVVAAPATQDSGGLNLGLLLGAIAGALLLLLLLVLLLVLFCRKRKRAKPEAFTAPAYINATYGDLEARGGGGAEYEDTEVVKKKVPLDGAVGVDNPVYDADKKKEIESSLYAVPNPYEEIPYDLGKARTASTDGYEEPRHVRAGHTELPRTPEGVSLDNPTYLNQGARPKGSASSPAPQPPLYREIPTPGEVDADPRPPAYTPREPRTANLRDFQHVRHDNINNEILDAKDVKIKQKTNK